MARSRRPELEKDNPIAPQVYSRRKRKHLAVDGQLPAALWETLQALTEAADAFVARTPASKKTEAERQALLDAITRAQVLLSVQPIPATDQ
ncbi:MAG TPA: hypothetical protein VFS39_15790 [Nitrospira sp.]|nr:hypothetical protein [Nitrospira sp.]